jgi:hypothetical protein
VRFFFGAFIATLLLSGCEAKSFGDACDGFFSNACRSPLTCMGDDKGKFCSQSCSINKAFPEMSDVCPGGAECVEATYEMGSKSGSMGSMCARPGKTAKK